MNFRHSMLIFLAVFVVAPTLCAQSLADTAHDELLRMKAATGGTHWDTVSFLAATGEKTSFGLTGKFHSFDNLATGAFDAGADYTLFANAEGLDRSNILSNKVRWRQDNSGGIHPLDSLEAQEVAVNESYFERRAYLFPEKFLADIGSVDAASEGARRFTRITLTPAGGRAFVLWIDSSTHLLDRAVMKLSIGSRTVRYAQYHSVHDLQLPFQISVEDRDEEETGTATLTSYSIGTTPSHDPVRPQPTRLDTTIASADSIARATGYLDASGFFIIEAKINGQGPFPFILDTGGHNILTVSAAHKLNLVLSGAGFSTGAGSGTTDTQFTSVKSLAIGAATLTAQPFTVLHLNLGNTQRGAHPEPIAGILGLELFERVAVTIDYRNSAVFLRPFSRVAVVAMGVRVPIYFTSDMPIVSAALDHHPGWFAVDTGDNAGLILSPFWAAANGLHPVLASAKMNGSSVGGDLDLIRSRTQSFLLADFELGPLDVLLAHENAGSLSARFEAGLFGNASLSRFTVTFDYATESMYLNPTTP